MKYFLKKQWVWLSVILTISSISISFADKHESDAEQEIGKPAGTPGHISNGRHGGFEDSIKAQSSPLSKPDDWGTESKPDSDAEQEFGRPGGTSGHRLRE